MYKRKLLIEIGSIVGRVAKLDMNTDNKVRGCFACMVVYVNLDKPLISPKMINDKIQRVEYESLLMVCFHCGRYGHLKEMCPQKTTENNHVNDSMSSIPSPKNKTTMEDETDKMPEPFGPWMLVEKNKAQI